MSGNGGGQSGVQTIQSNREPPAWQTPYIQQGLSEAQRLYQNPAEQYPNSNVVPFSPQSESALTGIENRAMFGNPLQGLGATQLGQTINGQFLDLGKIDLSGVGNSPGLQSAIDNATLATKRNFENTVAPGITSSWERAGRFGGGLMQKAQEQAGQALQNEYGRIARDMTFADYQANANRALQAQIATAQNQQQERSRMLNAAQYAPTFAQTDYADLDRLLGAGTAREGQAASQLADAMGRWNYDAQQPETDLNNFLARVSGNYGGTSTETRPIYSSGNSVLNSLLGVGAMAAGTYFGGPAGGAAASGLFNTVSPWNYRNPVNAGQYAPGGF